MAVTIPFWRENTGTCRRLSALIRYLHANIDLHIFYGAPIEGEDADRVARDWPDLNMTVFGRDEPRAGPATWWARLSDAVRRRIAPVERRHGIDRHFSARRKLAFERCCARIRPGNVILVTAYLAGLASDLRRRADRPRIVLLVDDIIHERIASLRAEGVGSELNVTRGDEVRAWSVADVIAAIHARDAETVRALLPQRRVIVTLHAEPPRPAEPTGNPDTAIGCIAAGGDTYYAALRAFFRDIWPPLRGRHGNGVRFVLAGSLGGRLAEAGLPEGVEDMGFVDDLGEFYRRVDILINPIAAGSGLKIKNVEALAFAKPLVTTPVGAVGLEEGIGEAFRVARSAEEWLAQLDELVADVDRRESLARGAQAFAEARLAPAAAYRALLGLLAEPELNSGP